MCKLFVICAHYECHQSTDTHLQTFTRHILFFFEQLASWRLPYALLDNEQYSLNGV